MAQTLYLSDGTMEVLLNERKDFPRIIRERLGQDAAQIVQRLLTENAYEEARAQTDCDSYEASLESNRSAFTDLLDQSERLERELRLKRLNRAALLAIAQQIAVIIENQI